VINIPSGTFDVSTVYIENLKGLAIKGAGIDQTILRRRPISWDNEKQGVPEWTDVIRGKYVSGLTLSDLTLDGNGFRMAIAGKKSSVMFPACKNGDGCGQVLDISLSEKVVVRNTKIMNAFRWAAAFGQVKKS
jgi:hypothetical protein